MEDKKTFNSFVILTSILNLILVYMLIKGLNYYIGNIRSEQNNQKLLNEFNNVYNEYSIKSKFEIKDIPLQKNRFSSSTSIAGYIEKLVFKTNEKSIQLYKNTVLSTTDREIIMQVTLYGTFDSISSVVKEIEEELPFTEITESTVEVSGKLYKVNLNLRILVDQK